MNKLLLLLLLAQFIAQLSFAQITKQKSVEELKGELSKIEASITATREKMKTIGDARFLPELYFVLAELYVTQSRYMISVKQLQNKSPDESDVTNEKHPKIQAIETYQQILDKFPSHPDRDKALFYMGHEYRELGQIDKMILTYQRLTREFPQSLYWSESQLIVANHVFEVKKDYDFALQLYTQILQRPSDSFTPLARYKCGWVNINLGHWQKSLQDFEGVLTTDAQIDLTKLPEIYRKTDVRRDALIAMVWPYSELSAKELDQIGPGKSDPLVYFRKLSNNLASYQKVLQRLARRMILKKRFIEATRVDFALLQVSEDIDTRMEAVESVYRAMKESGQSWPVVGYVEEVAKTAHMLKFSETTEGKARSAALHNYELFARDAATRLHARAKSTKSKADFKLATYAYQDYIWGFPNSKFRFEILLNLAEAYFNLGDTVQAGLAYEKLSQAYRSSSKGKGYLDSALQSYTQSLKESARLNHLEIVQARYGLRAVGAVYLKNYRQDQTVPEIMFNIARTYYDERNFESAVKAFESYLSQYPQDKNSALAADLILDSFNQREDYEGLIKAGEKLLKNKNLHSSVRNNVQEVVKQSRLKVVQMKAGGDVSSPLYAKNLLKLAAQYKGTDLGEQALYEAFISLKSKKDPEAYRPGETLLTKYGNSKYAKDVVHTMGQMAISTADFRRASNYFEIYAQKYPSDPQSKKLLLSAAMFRESMGDFAEAANDYQKLSNQEAIARNYYLASDWRSLMQAAAQVSGIKGTYWQGLAYYRMNNFNSAKPFLQNASSARTKNFEERTMAAHALYLLADESIKAYQTVQMESGHEQQAVQLKTQMLQQLTSQLHRVIQYGNGRWTIAALYDLGRSNQEFALFIQRAPLPPGLTQQQMDQFRAALQAQSKQYQKSADSFFAQCLGTAEKSDVFTQFVKGCQSHGREPVDEANETRNFAKAGNVAPPSAYAIRKKLYDNTKNAKLLIQLAQAYADTRDYAMSYTVLVRAAEVSPKTSSVYALQGTDALFMNDLDKAYELFQRSLTINSHDATALWGLAGLYKAFNYDKKFGTTHSRARSSGSPLPPIHPYVQAVR